ncbi:MAG: imidazole glycerol phosphate synthase subunit HisH, partial [Planctomycetota bacterium]
MDRRIHIVDTGVANMSSIEAGFRRQGLSVARSVDPDVIATATAVVLPGVGSFAAGIDAIDRNGLRSAIIDRLDGDRSTLVICLGLQMLCRS